MNLSLNTRLKKSDKVPWRIIEGEAILVDVDRGEIIHLNEVGAESWKIIDETRKVSDIIIHIFEHFDVEEEIAEKDTLEFLGKLFKRGIIEDISR